MTLSSKLFFHLKSKCEKFFIARCVIDMWRERRDVMRSEFYALLTHPSVMISRMLKINISPSQHEVCEFVEVGKLLKDVLSHIWCSNWNFLKEFSLNFLSVPPLAKEEDENRENECEPLRELRKTLVIFHERFLLSLLSKKFFTHTLHASYPLCKKCEAPKDAEYK